MPLVGRTGETKGEPMVWFGLSGPKLTCLRLFDWRLGLLRLREGLFDRRLELLFPSPLKSTVSS